MSTMSPARVQASGAGAARAQSIDAGELLFWAAAATGLVAAAILAALGHPLLAISSAVAAWAARIIVRHPTLATVAVTFVLYTNAGAIAVNFHGVPYVIAAAFPLLLLLPILQGFARRSERIVATPVLTLLFAYILVQFSSSIFAARTDVAINATLVTLVEGVLLYFLFTNAVRSTSSLRAVIWALLAAGAFMGSLTIIQHVTGTYANSYGGFAQCGELARLGAKKGVVLPDVLRHDGPLGEANRYAQIMAMLLPLAGAAVWTRQSARQGVIAIVAAAVIAITVALTMSRGVMVGLGLTLIAATMIGYVRARYLLVCALAIGLVALAVPRYAARVKSLADIAVYVTAEGPVAPTVDGAVRGRATEMKAAALMFSEHPVLGVGPGNYPQRYQGYARRIGGTVRAEQRRAHNMYVEIAAETGLLGLAVFSALAFVAVRDLRRARLRWSQVDPDRAQIATGVLLAVVVFFTTALFLHLSYARYFYMLMALAGAASYAPVSDTSRGRAPA